MDSSPFTATSPFRFGQGQESMSETDIPDTDTDTDFSGLLEIYVHHARNIHNICIYANQDVYAKFSLTCTPADTLSTRIVPGGGKNPQFDEKLSIKVPRRDAVLKCEIWMLSRARNFLEDQLLGFTLVPLSSIKNKLTQDFTLSSTELFHSPAGTVQLTLYLQGGGTPEPCSEPNSSITSEVVILDREDLKNLEFPDVGIANENQLMVSQYFETSAARLLNFGALLQFTDDYEMTLNSSGSDSPDGSVGNSGPFSSSTTTSLSDDRNRKEVHNGPKVDGAKSPDTPTSKSGGGVDTGNGKKEVFKSALGDINFEEEQSAMQQQIVDMYMRSMQQFTESLAKMKLPMDVDGGDVIQTQKTSDKTTEQTTTKKDGSRVFYGSRAFF